MNWKEQFDSKFVLRELGDYGEEQFDEDIDAQDVKDFISTEIIEKLIADIPNIKLPDRDGGISFTNYIKQQLRDKWL